MSNETLAAMANPLFVIIFLATILSVRQCLVWLGRWDKPDWLTGLLILSGFFALLRDLIGWFG